MSFQIAVDGPVAAGKGTTCRIVADRLGILYVDTGAMYRAAALIAQREGIEFNNEAKLVPLIHEAHISLSVPTDDELDGRLITVKLGDEDVSWKIRTEEVGQSAAQVAQLAGVRKALVAKQQLIASQQDVIMEGRDITTVVLPDANLKIFLTANDTIRAKRRHFQLISQGKDVTFEQIHSELQARDKRDMERDNDPLTIVPEAWVIDTSDLSIDQTARMIVERVGVMRG